MDHILPLIDEQVVDAVHRPGLKRASPSRTHAYILTDRSVSDMISGHVFQQEIEAPLSDLAKHRQAKHAEQPGGIEVDLH